jgi:predicted ATP-dependent serine protease
MSSKFDHKGDSRIKDRIPLTIGDSLIRARAQSLNRTKCRNCGRRIEKTYCKTCRTFTFSNTPKILESPKDESVLLSDVKDEIIKRISVGYGKLAGVDFVFGPANGRDRDGIASTSVNLVSGIRGSGKSTLALQIASIMGGLILESPQIVMYIGTEQSLPEIKSYATRLKLTNMHKIRLIPAMSGAGDIISQIYKYKPYALFLDSLPGLSGENPIVAVDQAKILKNLSVELQYPTMIINHVTKDQDTAGLAALQHQVDGVYEMYAVDPAGHVIDIDDNETMESSDIRELRVVGKNRNGKAWISVYFEMTEEGLVITEAPE